MPASKYKIWALGAAVGEGATQSVHVGVAAIAKKSTKGEPNIVLNEIFCSLIGRSLFLPLPPGALLDNGGETYFSSLNFNLAGHALPPAPPTTIVAELPELSWGITLFDILIMNPDRHNKNISYNRHTKELQIFDHSHAFLRPSGDADSVIKDNAGKLAIGSHCLKGELTGMLGFSYWCDRIKSLPDYAIEESVRAAGKLGLQQDKRIQLIDFIKSRRDNIDILVTNNLSEFPKIPPLTLAPPPPAIVAATPAATAAAAIAQSPAPAASHTP